MYKIFFKRVLDVVLATMVFIVMSPIFLLLMVLLWLANGGSPFFTQLRPGKDGRPFYVVKFKTMSDTRDDSGQLLHDDQRLTRIGKFVRRTSLDELPQLLNVILGQMALIGPRPLLMEYLKLYSPDQHRRHEVRPGITGWAQVNGRNTVAWKERFAYDVWYVDHISFMLDMKILWRTIKKVLKAEGISGTTSITMEKFKGNQVQ